MDDMNNKENENQNEEAAFGSREYYKNLYGDMPEDVAEMLIGTHPLMKKEVSEELTNSIKIKSAQHKNLRAVEEDLAEAEPETDFEEPEVPSASKDPVEDSSEETVIEEARLRSRLGGKVSAASDDSYEDFEEPESADDKSEDDLTAEKIARMLGGVNVEEVEDEEAFEEVEEAPVKPKKEERTERPSKNGKPRKKRRTISEKDLELDNIDKQAGLNELFREDDDYFEEKHSGNNVARIGIIVVAVVILAIFVYKVASLSGTVSKLEAQIETYKTMETEYEQLKLEKLALEEQVETYEAQLTGGTPSTPATPNANTTTPSTPASNNAGAKTYTVKNGDTFWGIATKMYGNGAYYEKILKANGLHENDKIKEGMTLTIPAA